MIWFVVVVVVVFFFFFDSTLPQTATRFVRVIMAAMRGRRRDTRRDLFPRISHLPEGEGGGYKRGKVSVAFRSSTDARVIRREMPRECSKSPFCGLSYYDYCYDEADQSSAWMKRADALEREFSQDNFFHSRLASPLRFVTYKWTHVLRSKLFAANWRQSRALNHAQRFSRSRALMRLYP